MTTEKTAVIRDICEYLLGGDREKAKQMARRDYPFNPISGHKLQYTPLQVMKVFIRDGFIDRYSGKRLVFPGILRILYHECPDEFPFQSHWEMSETHLAFWELFPTIDHVIPISRGGADEESNMVTTSMLRNSAKANWTLAELGWEYHPPGDIDEWDGLILIFLEFIKIREKLLDDPNIRRWHHALQSVLE